MIDKGFCLTLALCSMSKITLEAILTLLRLAIVVSSKAARLIYTVVDLCDDGIINQSAEKPAWYEHLVRIIRLLEDATSSISNIEDEIVL